MKLVLFVEGLTRAICRVTLLFASKLSIQTTAAAQSAHSSSAK